MQQAIATQPVVDAAPSCDVYTWGPEDVARALGIKPAAFRAQRTRLEGQGFPRPLPVLRARWSIEAVRAWIALSGMEG